jgi:sensor c-di-GMP phosphodiesterase-like protein
VSRLQASEPAPVASGVISIAHALGLATVAEGVEGAVQQAWLQQAGCDSLQRCFFAQPMAPAEVLDYLP